MTSAYRFCCLLILLLLQCQQAHGLTTSFRRQSLLLIRSQHPAVIQSAPTFMSSSPEEQPPATNVSSSESEGEDEIEGQKGVTKTILLTIPLFCKFVIVLVIKFLTDLIVFPLLWTYRLARLSKRKILSAFRKNQKVNGGHNGTSTP